MDSPRISIAFHGTEVQKIINIYGYSYCRRVRNLLSLSIYITVVIVVRNFVSKCASLTVSGQEAVEKILCSGGYNHAWLKHAC